MKNKSWLISLCITLLYFIVSNIVFYNTFASSPSTSYFLVTLPALVTFGTAYASGTFAGLIAALISFSVLWIVWYLLLYVSFKIYSTTSKK